MRHTLQLVAALGLIAAIGPSALAQDQDKPSSQPTTSEPATTSPTPAALPATYSQPVMPGQMVSPYAPAYSGTATPCGYVMPSAYVPGTVMFGPQYQQYQPQARYGSNRRMISRNPVAMPYDQQTAMPIAGSVAGGVITQPGTLQLNGTNTYSGMTYQPYQTGMVYPNGMTSQPGTVYQAGTMGPYSDQPVILTGYSNSSFDTGMTTTQTGRRGLFGRLRR
ncbi:MAG TPA: hypothetical protein VFG68_21815 [Fimbriiglobus sp.]|nr:hypothetical protein [Fimbriiglobus sp.]